MKKAIFLLTAIAAFASCSKSGSDDSYPAPGPSGVVMKEATMIVFENNDAFGNPTTVYAKNTNTGESVFVSDINPAGTYSIEFHGLGGRSITGTPRAGSTNVVGFNAGVNDTLILKLNGAENKRVLLKNDALNILNGGIFATRMSLETNTQAGVRINSYTAPGGPMSTAKFKVF